MVREIGIEGDAVSFPELVGPAVEMQDERPGLNDGRLAAPAFVQRGIARTAGGRSGTQRMQGHRDALSGERRRQLLEAVAVTGHAPPVRTTDDGHVRLVEAKELR
jgi:hypothetical protein